MEPIIVGGPPRQCKSCLAKNIQAFYTCEECERKGIGKNFDICLNCAAAPTCEAHTGNMGSAHQFLFTRRRRICGRCSDDIDADFISCPGCEKSPPTFDLCPQCLLNVRAKDELPEHRQPHVRILNFTRWRHNRPSFKLIKVILTSPTEVAKRTTCGCGEKFSGTRTKFFLSSPGKSVCIKCADNGGLFKIAGHNDVWLYAYSVYAGDDVHEEDHSSAKGGFVPGSGPSSHYNNPERAN